MAIGRLNVRVGKKGKGLAHVNYILREDKYKPHAEKLEKLEKVGHGNMPEWANNNPKLFWQLSDEFERENGSVYREHIIALPRELSEEQRLALVVEWIENEIGDKHPYSFAIHCPLAADNKEQPHVHFMFSERTHDGIERCADQFFKRFNRKYPEHGGAEKSNKNASWTDRKQALKDRRMRWQELCNLHLKQAGLEVRIDMRNYKERGLTQKPLNVPMKYMFKPGMKDAYKDWLNAKQGYRKSMVLVRKTLDGNSLVNEINFQQERKHEESVRAAFKAKYKQWKSLKNQPQSQVTLDTIHGKESLDEKAKSYQGLLTQSSLSSSKSLPDPQVESQFNTVPSLSFAERHQAWKQEQERLRQEEMEREKQRQIEQQAQQRKQEEFVRQQQLQKQLEQQRFAEIERKAAEQAALLKQQLEQQRQRELEEQRAQERRRDRGGPSP